MLYPLPFRAEFASEMLEVHSTAAAEQSGKGALAHSLFAFREMKGLLAGAVREHLRARLGEYQWFHSPTWRFHMRSDFRFPRAAAPMMLVLFAGVLFAIYKARAVYVHENVSYPLPDVPVTFGLALLFACLAGAIGWLVMHSLHRSGVHRLSEAETWPQPK
jgi:hypothetical protein